MLHKKHMKHKKDCRLQSTRYAGHYGTTEPPAMQHQYQPSYQSDVPENCSPYRSWSWDKRWGGGGGRKWCGGGGGGEKDGLRQFL